MSGEHTPGPWIVFHLDGIFAVLPAGRSGTIATGIRNRADADLIAAAPETAAERDRLRAEVKRLTEDFKEQA